MADIHPIPTDPRFQDLTGQSFSRLTVLSFAGRNRHGKSTWFCVCRCGTETTVVAGSLRSGETTSCGRGFACFSKDEYEAMRRDYILDAVEMTTRGCWKWIKRIRPDGYGESEYRGKTIQAHILSYRVFVGDTNGLCVLHRCDNPPCVNPGHLFLGTHADNVADKVAKLRHLRHETHPMAKLTESDVVLIRQLYVPRKVTLQSLATRFGVSQSAIWLIVRGLKWK